MLLRVINHSFHYECENLCRMFFPNSPLRVIREMSVEPSENVVEDAIDTILSESSDGVTLSVHVCVNFVEDSRVKTVEKGADNDLLEYELAVLLFKVLKKLTGYTPDWGILTGVRPSKLMLRLNTLYGAEGARKYFTDNLFVSADKAALTAEVVEREQKIIQSSSPESFSLYIAIPFCPSRCSYCSFVSHSVTSRGAKTLIPEYVKKLSEEIYLTGRIADSLGLRLESVYFGGGTPTSLSAQQLDELCSAVRDSFDMSRCREYTVEAGRPDTVTEDKIRTLVSNGVTRISINPQTLNDEVLKYIGRNHTAEQVLEAYALARSAGFNGAINMDLIAGLPNDTAESFEHTLDGIFSLNPENITIHTLALKRSSSLVTDGQELCTDVGTVSKMLSSAQSRLVLNGYKPYYMYRQSRCIGNFENVGWCREGFEGIYNVFMMEECHTVLACGAGGVTKLCRFSDGYVERIFNLKYPYEYIGRFDALMERKDRITEFY